MHSIIENRRFPCLGSVIRREVGVETPSMSLTFERAMDEGDCGDSQPFGDLPVV